MSNLINWRARLFGTPLLLTPAYAEVIVSVLSERLGVEPVAGASSAESFVRPQRIRTSMESMLNAPAAGRYVRSGNSPTFDPRTGIAVYPIVGSMVHRGDGIDSLSGIQSYTSLQRDLGTLLDSPKVRAILLDLDTPGGEVAGLSELADWIKAARDEKPIWALANSRACSAGYWLASACSRVVAAPASSVGSIGVLTMHVDVSKAAEKRGIVHTFIHAGKHKIDGHPYAPLPDAVKADIQAGVDTLYIQFVSEIASMRGISFDSVRGTEASVFGPNEALKQGLIDNVATFGETLKLLYDSLSNSLPNIGEAAHRNTAPRNTLPENAASARVDSFLNLPEAAGKARSAAKLAADYPGLTPEQGRRFLRGAPTDAAIAAQRNAPLITHGEQTMSSTTPADMAKRRAELGNAMKGMQGARVPLRELAGEPQATPQPVDREARRAELSALGKSMLGRR